VTKKKRERERSEEMETFIEEVGELVRERDAIARVDWKRYGFLESTKLRISRGSDSSDVHSFMWNDAFRYILVFKVYNNDSIMVQDFYGDRKPVSRCYVGENYNEGLARLYTLLLTHFSSPLSM
jgi:hypothetical protein